MGIGDINRRLDFATDNLGIEDYSGKDIARLAGIFTQATRFYHTLDHIEGMTDFADKELRNKINDPALYLKSQSWQTIAGFWHDLFQLRIDRGHPQGYEWALGGNYINEMLESGIYKVSRPEKIPDDIYNIICVLFDVADGQELPLDFKNGRASNVNEFLTCIAATDDLHRKGADLKNIAAVVGIIKSSVPFREGDRIYKLHDRFIVVGKKFGFELTTNEVDAICYSAANFANRDVENFAGQFLKFIDKTRQLIPELSPDIRANAKAISFRDCFVGHTNLLKLVQADAIEVFCEYNGLPSKEKIEKINERSVKNSRLGEDYLRSRYVASTVIGAIAITSNLADITLGNMVKGMGSLLTISANKKVELSVEEKKVLQALNGDQMTHLEGIDLPAAPLASFLYRALGKEGMYNLFLSSKEVTLTGDDIRTNKASAEKFLRAVHQKMGSSYHDVLAAMSNLPSRGYMRD